MVNFGGKKARRSEEHSLIGASKTDVSLIIFAIIVFTAIATSCFAAENSISWTEDELAFMESHPVIRLGVDHGFVPFEFIDEDGEYKGIAADYLALISEKTGLQFEILKGLTWPEVYERALTGNVDALPAIGRTDEREKHFLFSEPYYYYKRVIVTRDIDTEISSIDDLKGYAVAVQRNSSHHSYLSSYPNINLSIYDSAEAALAAVATGTEKAFIGNLATTNYLIRSNGLTNLRFVAFEAEKQQALYFAVRKDRPQLVSIINKALNSIPESEKLAINKKWIDLDTDFDYGPIIRILSIVGALTAVVLSVSFFWIARLQKEIRHRKQIQLELEQAKYEADKANEFKSNFMARMSHEIRTPLNAITGLSYLLKKTEISVTQNMYIDRIIQAANNMLSIINDILDFAKIEAGKVELEITSFSMNQLIQNVVNIVSYKISEQGIGFRLRKDPFVPNWFFGDPKRLEQILLNVLNNAVKFTSAGEVSLDVRLIGKENDEHHILFTIKDTGIGMSEEQVNKLFKPFEQGDSSINRRFGGSGLGLSIVKNLLDMMGGTIEVFSTPGEGSTFILRLSLNVDKEKEDVYLKTLSSEHFRQIKTLVLEKTSADINLIESYLSSFGMHSELTSSEASALSMIEDANGKFGKPFDLFIIDYDTPAGGGFNFIETIRNNDKIVKFPKIIMLLPMMREDLFDKLNEHGIDLGIGKPIIPSILLNGIMDIFNLKAVSPSQPATGRESGPAKLDKPHRVLLVEDNKTNQLIAESLLEQVGIKSIIANDGKEAVERFREHRDSIDLILMDLHMPVMNGYEAAEKIRELSTGVPIVAMTADVIMGVRDKCAQSGIYHYISKPFNPDHFIQTVKDIIIANEFNADTDKAVLNRQLGLRNMGDNLDLYHRVLEEYRNENQDTLDRLEAAIREKRYADAAQIVHKVKSSSGSISAKSLHEMAISLQKALKEEKEDEIAPLHEGFSKLLRKLLEEIKVILRETGSERGLKKEGV
ncbi:MAG: transporter substrate-binding domain-containing protein [Firmicutes bacterium]|nr:transporter substrate-binding domain-containing protein [Bacillota bacterium]